MILCLTVHFVQIQSIKSTSILGIYVAHKEHTQTWTLLVVFAAETHPPMVTVVTPAD